jgi:hypothetical protein
LSPVTHYLLSWMVANSAKLARKERAVVTLAGVAPDLDGLGIVPEWLTRNSAHPLNWFSEYHHTLGHNLGFAPGGYRRCRLHRQSWLEMEDSDAGLNNLPSSSVVRSGGSARAGWGAVGDSISCSFFAGLAVELAWPVGIECLAQFCNHDRSFGNGVLPGVETRLFSARNVFP